MIYKDKAFFRFLYIEDGQSKTYLLPEEPINWDKVDIILKRDTVFHGVNYQYTDGDIQLEFAEDCGLSIIDLVYSKDGSDGDITLQFGFSTRNGEQVEYEGKLNLNTYRKFKGRVSCTLEMTGFHELINSRLDTKIDLFDTKTLDGIDKTSKEIDLTLHSKRLLRSTIVKNTETNNSFDGEGSADATLYFTFDFLDEALTDIKDFLSNGLSVLTTEPGYSEEVEVPLFEIVEAGNYSFYFNFKFGLGYMLKPSSTPPPPNLNNWQMLILFKIKRGGSFITHEKEVLYDTGIRTDANQIVEGGYKVGFEYSFATEANIASITLQAGDKIYVYGKIIPNATHESGIFLSIRSEYQEGEENKIEILKASALTEAVESQAKGILIYEALESAMYSVTNQSGVIDSEYFGRDELGYVQDGEGSKFVLTNGFFIRNFNTGLRGLNTSLKEMFSSLQSIFGIGIAYEFDSGKQRLKIEPISYYYGIQEIIRIEHCDEYSEETAKEFIYNELSVGYDKYPDSGQYLLDEYNTQLEFLTPIRTNKNKLELRSDFIASGFAIEETRREQFETKQKDSTTYDDNVFIISVVEETGSWESEKIENFSIENVIDPASSYNVRITPKRNLIRLAKWINSGLFFKKGFEILKNTSFRNNGETRTKKSTESEYLQENSDIILNNFDNRQLLFKPVWISFKCRLPFIQIQKIKSAHIQKDHLQKNGYITVKNRDGLWKSGYLFEMTFNPSKEEVTIKMLEKAESQTGVNCSDYKAFTFENLENTKLPEWIEDCTFANFN